MRLDAGQAPRARADPFDKIYSFNPASLLITPPPLRFGSATWKSIVADWRPERAAKGAWWARRDFRLAAL